MKEQANKAFSDMLDQWCQVGPDEIGGKVNNQQELIPHLKIGEIVKIEGLKYQVVETDKLDVVGMNKVCGIKRVG